MTIPTMSIRSASFALRLNAQAFDQQERAHTAPPAPAMPAASASFRR
jgi:hypothetical protein